MNFLYEFVGFLAAEFVGLSYFNQIDRKLIEKFHEKLICLKIYVEIFFFC